MIIDKCSLYFDLKQKMQKPIICTACSLYFNLKQKHAKANYLYCLMFREMIRKIISITSESRFIPTQATIATKVMPIKLLKKKV